MYNIDLLLFNFLSFIVWFPWLSFFSSFWILQFLMIYILFLLFKTLNPYYSLLYLFIEIILLGLFLGYYQLELFTGFLWVLEGSVIFISLLLLFYLNVEGSIFKLNLKKFSFFFLFSIILFFFLKKNFNINFNIFFWNNLCFNYFELYDDFYESLFNKNVNDFLVLFISYYSINNFEYLTVGIILLIGSLICVNLNKLQKLVKIKSLPTFLKFFKFEKNLLDFFFFRKQNLTTQTNQIPSLRIFKKKK